MKYNVNTLMLNFIDVGMYETRIDPRYSLYTERIDEDRKEGYIKYDEDYFWANFDNKAYNTHVAATAKHIYNGKYVIKGVPVKIEMGSEIFSPSQYNFSTDSLDLDITIAKHRVMKYAKDHKDSFNDFLYENYSSYDGFMSFIPNNYSDWVININGGSNLDKERAVSAFLNFLFADFTMYDDDYSEDRENSFGEFPNYVQFCESVEQDLYYNEFITDEAYKRSKDEDFNLTDFA